MPRAAQNTPAQNTPAARAPTDPGSRTADPGIRADGGRRWLALTVLSSTQLMIVLDGTVVTVALPTISTDLGFSPAGLAWVVNAYLIAFAGLLLLAGRLGDLIGRARVFLAGLVVFTSASLLCAASTSATALVTARFVQGVGGALASAVALGMVVTLFPEPRPRAKAIGIYSFVQASGASIGLIAGGVLTAVSWHWIFLINIPIGAVATVAAVRLFPPRRTSGSGTRPAPGTRAASRLRSDADAAGAVLVTAGLMLGVGTIVRAADLGWVCLPTLGGGAAALALLSAFALREFTARRPLLPPRLVRSRQTAGANAVMGLFVAGMFGFQFLTALYLQRVLGYGPVRTGLAFVVTPVAIAAVSLGCAAPLAARFGARTVLAGGLGTVLAGLLLLARAPVDGRYAVDLLPVLVLLGIGFGAAMPALMGLAMSGADAADAGLASGLVNTTQQAGGAVGLAVLATLAAARTGALRHAGRDTASALTGGYHLAFGVSAVFVTAAIVVTLVVLRETAAPDRDDDATPAAGAEAPRA